MYKIVCKFVAKLIKYMMLFKDILTFLGLDYRDASLITFYLVHTKTYGLSGINYRVALLSKLYLTVTEITLETLKSIGQF